MRTLRVSLLAGIAAVAVAGFSGWAHAQSAQLHTMTVRLPGGGVEQIEYTGNTPPQVSVSTGPATIAAMPPVFGSNSLFAQMDRISAKMDRQANALFRETAALTDSPSLLTRTNLAGMPAGSDSYTFVSTASPGGVCEQSVWITATATARRRSCATPPVIARRWAARGDPARARAGCGRRRPHMIMTRAHRVARGSSQRQWS